MALRFFLVSAVASLGLTFPEGGEFRTWAAVTQRWANAQLAQWDTHCARDGGLKVLLEPPEMPAPIESMRGDGLFDAAMDEMLHSFATDCSTAPARQERMTNLTARTFEPMSIGENLYTGTAYALNRASEGLGIAHCSIQAREAPADRPSLAVAGEKGSLRNRAKTASGQSDTGFEPMVVDDDLYVGVAFSLNRASEGTGFTTEGRTLQAPDDRGSEPAVNSRVSEFSAALRLTREAVSAWSNLLHGPAVVAITR